MYPAMSSLLWPPLTTLKLSVKTAKQESTLSEFALYGVPDFTAADPDLDSTADVGSRFEYAGVIDQAKQTISVDVPWSVYAQWGLDEYFKAIAEAVEDSNALFTSRLLMETMSL